MKKFLNGMLALFLVLALAGCGCQKKDNPTGGDNPSGNNPGGETEEVVYHSAAELKELAKKAGYITNDYLACYTGLTEEQMEGFTVELQNEDKTLNSYCVIVTVDEPTAKQLCDNMQNEFTTCIRSGQSVAFPESSASAEFIKMLTSIVQGRPVTAPEYVFE